MSSHPSTVHIVPHTHWDREWYLTYQQFRIHLVRLIDGLLEIMKDDGYVHFLLDGQTIVLEDYLEIRPEKEQELASLIRSGRLAVGPWYVLPDLFLVSGESIIRNLQIGRKVASRFGHAMNVGYMPDQFGFVTQMPQILRGFGIETAVVWRGFEASLPQELWWQAPDGSRVLTHKLDAVGGYLNAAELCMDSPDKACEQVRDAVDWMSAGAPSGQFLLMNGVDHRFPNPKLPEIVRSLNESMPGQTVSLSSLAGYFDAVRECVGDIPVVDGEQRRAEKMEMLQGTLSTRMYLKQANERMETLLALQTEPLCAFAWLLGAEYPSEMLNHAWKKLLENHAHDSICGCSLDEVHTEMLTRFASVGQIGDMLCEHATKQIADALSGDADGTTREQSLVVFNTLPWVRSGIVDAEVRIPAALADQTFDLFDGEVSVPYTVVSHEDNFVAYNPANSLDSFPTFDVTHRYGVRFLAEDVPGWGYRAFEIRPGLAGGSGRERIEDFTTAAGLPGAVTDCLRISFNQDGTFDLRDLRTGTDYCGLHRFEDTGDCGDEYCYCAPDADRVVTTAAAPASVSVALSGLDFRTFMVQREILVPCGLVRGATCRRSNESTPLTIVSHITVASGVPRADIVTHVMNTARDHRLRVLFPTDTKASVSFSETAFDIVRRPVSLPDHEGWKEAPQPTHPQLNFCGASGDGRVLTLANRGLTEYELCADSRSTLALTLLRCVEWGSRGDLTNTTRAHREDGSPGSNYMFTPGAQCLGAHEFHYSVIPGSESSGVEHGLRQAYDHKVQLVAHQRSLSRSAPRHGAFVSASSPAHVAPSALKVSDTKGQLVLRMANMSEDGAEVRVGMERGISAAAALDLSEVALSELPFEHREVTVEFPPKSIVSVGIVPDRRSGR